MGDKGKKKNKVRKGNDEADITRKAAIKRTGKYALLTASTMLVLSPKGAQAQSPAPQETAPEPGW